VGLPPPKLEKKSAKGLPAGGAVAAFTLVVSLIDLAAGANALAWLQTAAAARKAVIDLGWNMVVVELLIEVG